MNQQGSKCYKKIHFFFLVDKLFIDITKTPLHSKINTVLLHVESKSTYQSKTNTLLATFTI